MKDDKMVESNNAFVKREQQRMKGMMGNRPKMPAEMMDFCAYMSNDGEAAQNLARDLTRTMEDAFPVK